MLRSISSKSFGSLVGMHIFIHKGESPVGGSPSLNQLLINFLGRLFLFEESFHLAHRLFGGAFGLVDRVLWGVGD